MLAYSAQDLILEPFAGAVFGFTPGESTQLSGVQHGGVLAGMLLAALAGRRVGAASASARCAAGRSAAASPRRWRCWAWCWPARMAPHWPLRANVFALGVANGAFSIAAIGSMMALAGGPRRQAAKACAWACGARRRPSPLASAAWSAPRSATWRAGCSAPGAGLCVGLPARGGPVPGRRRAGRRASPSNPPRHVPCPAPPGTVTPLPSAQPGGHHECNDDGPGSTSWWSAAARPAPPPPTTWRARAAACCCSTAPGASSPAAARSRRG